MSKKTGLCIFRFVSMFFLIFEKGMSKKTGPGIFRFVSMLLLLFEKGMSKNTGPGISRFVSMLFNVIINVIILVWKGIIVVFEVCMYAFYDYCYFKKISGIKRVI